MRILEKIKFWEWKAIVICSVVLMLLAAGPLIVIWLSLEPGWVWSGVERVSSGDLPVYFSYINQAKEGHFFLHDLHTIEPERYGTINLFWWGLGQKARIFNISPQAVFHTSRLLLMPFLVFSLYLLIAEFLTSARSRVAALALIIFGSGFGGLATPLINGAAWSRDGRFNFPMDLWVPELTVLGSALQSPHFIVSWICFALTVLFLVKAMKQNSIKFSAAAGTLGLFFFHFHPYYAPLFFILAGAVGIIFVRDGLKPRAAAKLALLFILISAPAVVYHAFLNLFDPIVFARTSQNLTWSTPLTLTLISFGLFLPLALTAYKKWKESAQVRVLMVWAGIQFLFLYAPFSFQRRFAEGLIIPLALLTVIGAPGFFVMIKECLAKTIKNKTALSLVCGMLIFLGFGYSNYVMLASRMRDARKIKPPTYFEESFLGAMEAMGKLPGNSVMGSFATGNFLPAISNKRVYAGHWSETIFYEQKELAVKKFYNGETKDDWRINFLDREGIGLVVWGEAEQKLGSWDPFRSPFLKLEYKNGNTAIFIFENKNSPPTGRDLTPEELKD